MKCRDINKALLQKGFQKEKERDHDFYFFYYKGKKTSVWTKMSHGEKDVYDELISRMYKQMKIKKKQFLDFVDCELTKEKYQKFLLENNHIRASFVN